MNESTPNVETEAVEQINTVPASEAEMSQVVSKVQFGKFLKVSLGCLGVLLALDLVLLAAGFALSDYSTVNTLSQISYILMYPIGILSGLCLSVYTARVNAFIHNLELSTNPILRKNTYLAVIFPSSIIAAIVLNRSNFLLALLILIVFPISGYIVWRKRGKSYGGWQKIILYGFAALMGILPGAIAAFIIALVLSDRACSLSSSKCY